MNAQDPRGPLPLEQRSYCPAFQPGGGPCKLSGEDCEREHVHHAEPRRKTRARFVVPARLDGPMADAVVVIDRAGMLFTVWRKGRRKRYTVTLGAAAEMVYAACARGEEQRTRAAKGKRARKVRRGRV